MELRDQITADQAHRAWAAYDEVEKGALLVELSASLRRRLTTLEVDHQTAAAYRKFAHAARTTGHALIFKHGVPFVPDPPFEWSKLRIEQVHERLPEIQDWACSNVLSPEQTLPVRHTALDLTEAGRELERCFQHDRGR